MLIHIINSLPWSSFTEVNLITYWLLNKGIAQQSKLQLGGKKKKKENFHPVSLSEKCGEIEVFFPRPTESAGPTSSFDPLLITVSKINPLSQLETCLSSQIS